MHDQLTRPVSLEIPVDPAVEEVGVDDQARNNVVALDRPSRKDRRHSSRHRMKFLAQENAALRQQISQARGIAGHAMRDLKAMCDEVLACSPVDPPSPARQRAQVIIDQLSGGEGRQPTQDPRQAG